MRLVSTAVALLVLACLPAAGQKVSEIAFFKGSTGIWGGKGKSQVGPEKEQLEVVDVWKGQLVEDGTIFIQDGRVTLSEGGSFGYRWVYRYEKGKLIARYVDSTKNGGILAVKVSEDGRTLTLTPLTMEL